MDKEKRQNTVIEPFQQDGEHHLDFSLRPKVINEYVGQNKIRQNLNVYIKAALKRQDTLDHTLLCGPPGLGKTTLANIIANEMGVHIKVTSGPALERAGDIAAILTNLEPMDVLFIDEVHRLNRVVEETLYPAMEDFKIDVILGQGPAARSVQLEVPRFTLVGATTRAGLLSSPLRDRFGISFRLAFYNAQELQQIIERSAQLLEINIEPKASMELARRSRGTPRIANRLLKRVRDFANVANQDSISFAIAEEALSRMGVDQEGLDEMDQKILMTIMDQYDGGPVGLDALAATVGEERGTLEEVYEPYLIKEGYIQRTPKGRLATSKAYVHFKRERSKRIEGQLQF